LKKPLALIASIAAVIALSGCAPSNPADALFAGAQQVCESYTTGEAADSIEVTGAKGAVPTVKFATPLNSKVIETKVVTEGTGPKFTGNQLVKVEFVGINGGTGETFQATAFDGTDAVSQFMAEGGTPDFCHAMSGVREGSRVAILMPADLAHSGQGIPDLGIGATDSIVFLFDVLKVYLPKALGDAQAAQSGFPAVVRATTGEPGVTMPKTDAPKELKIETLIKGRGEVVEEGQLITVHYSGFLWSDGTQFDSSWTNGQPAQFSLTKGQLIEGFIQSLVGQTVGSQVVAVIPPELGYGDSATGSIPAGSTLVFVMDILGTD
jgi:peptidylprolyl isomerase